MKTEPLPPMPSTTLDHLRPDQICDEPPALFSLGNVVATPAALALIEKHDASVQQLLNRHQTGDWQELCVASRTIIWPLVKQIRPLHVPLLHGLHRRLAAQC